MDRLYCIEYESYPRYVIEREGVWRLVNGSVFGDFELGGEIRRNGAKLLPPVRPSKIVAVGLNYRDHAAEQKKPLPREPIIFLKPSTAVIGPGEAIVVPPGIGRVDHEAELGVVICKRASRVPADRAAEYILGFTCVNDVTARDLQNRDIQYARCKGYDTFAPVGPCILRAIDGDHRDVEGWVNGVRRQASNTRELIFSVAELVSYITGIMTLLPGDVISTGTPAGIGPIVPGDSVTIKVDGVGELTNPVRALQELA
ncbi:MAG: fumarylacetoacetate hydrolase family protein [Acidobacteria bacterium]|nr:fumarylacetoacetate hydrolase family protein [Acidobacteriota bacterium]